MMFRSSPSKHYVKLTLDDGEVIVRSPACFLNINGDVINLRSEHAKEELVGVDENAEQRLQRIVKVEIAIDRKKPPINIIIMKDLRSLRELYVKGGRLALVECVGCTVLEHLDIKDTDTLRLDLEHTATKTDAYLPSTVIKVTATPRTFIHDLEGFLNKENAPDIILGDRFF